MSDGAMLCVSSNHNTHKQGPGREDLSQLSLRRHACTDGNELEEYDFFETQSQQAINRFVNFPEPSQQGVMKPRVRFFSRLQQPAIQRNQGVMTLHTIYW